MKYSFKSGTTRKGDKYIVWWNDQDLEKSIKVATFKDNNTTLSIRIKDTTSKKSIIVSGTKGRDNKVALTFAKDGSAESDSAWSIICMTTTNLNDDKGVISIDNLSTTCIVEEI
jgi:hypothetical protein